MAALIRDAFSDRYIRSLISPYSSCGRFTLHNPTCFQISGPKYSTPPDDALSVRTPLSSNSERYPAVPVICNDCDCAGPPAIYRATATSAAFTRIFMAPYLAATGPNCVSFSHGLGHNPTGEAHPAIRKIEM